MKENFVNLFKFFGAIVWTVVGFCAGGLAGTEVFVKWLAPVRQFPQPNDATGPMVLICALIGSVVGAILAQVSGYLLLAKFRAVSRL